MQMITQALQYLLVKRWIKENQAMRAGYLLDPDKWYIIDNTQRNDFIYGSAK